MQSLTSIFGGRFLGMAIGLRYVRSSRSFLSFVSLIAIVGLVISVSVLLFVQGVVGGFERELKTRILGVLPHVTLYGLEHLREVESAQSIVSQSNGVAGLDLVVTGPGLLSNGSKVVGTIVTGITPISYESVSSINTYISDFDRSDWKAGQFQIVVGRGAAQALDLIVGNQVSLTLPEMTASPVGFFPRQKRFTVAAIFDTDSELDSSHVYLHINDADTLFRSRQNRAIQVRLKDPLLVVEAVSSFYEKTDNQMLITSWLSQHGALYGAIQVQKGMMLLLLSLLVAVAAFNLVSSLIMAVNERQGDIAILRTIGSARGLIMSMFVTMGMVISSIGVLLGIVLGYLLGLFAEAGFPWLEKTFEVHLMSEYVVHSLPVEYNSMDVIKVSLISGILSLIASVYPSWRASNLNPAEVLQDE